MEKPSPYLMNAWYVAALPHEIEAEAFFHRTLLDMSILFYRKANGEPVALRNRCPHRFVPLHLGRREGDDVVCGYHGLKFDDCGRCILSPHGDGKIPQAAKVRSFPLLERWGFVWIWMGDEPADPAKLPDFSPLVTGHPNGVGWSYMHVKGNYELIMDNVMDLSHVDYVHGEFISTRGQLSPKIPRVVDGERFITAHWTWEQTPPVLAFADFLPRPKEEARHFFDLAWTPPANIQLTVGATQGDGPLTLENTIGQYDLHTATPETENTTHYFFASRRNHIEEDGDFNTMKIAAMHAAFSTEDGPILEAVHGEMKTTDFFSLNPVLMSNDVAPVRVRKLLKKLRDAERSGT